MWGFCLNLEAGEKFLLMQEVRLGQLSSAYAGKEDPNVPPEAKAIATKIVKEADKRMGRPVITITENKNLQASKDPHDYFSTPVTTGRIHRNPMGCPTFEKTEKVTRNTMKCPTRRS